MTPTKRGQPLRNPETSWAVVRVDDDVHSEEHCEETLYSHKASPVTYAMLFIAKWENLPVMTYDPL